MSVPDETVVDRRQPAVAAPPRALEPTMSLDWALQTVGHNCLSDVLRERRSVIGGDAEGVHQMRVAVRRLRSFLSAAKPWLPLSQYRWASERLKLIGQQLSQGRNWDVIATSMVPAVMQNGHVDRTHEVFVRTVDRKRRAMLRATVATVRSERFTAEVMALVRWFETSGWRADTRSSEVLGDVARAMLTACHRRVRSQSRHFRRLTSADRHELRIAIKKLRYVAELTSGFFDPAQVEPFVLKAEVAQEGLGSVNDLDVAQQLIVQLSDAAGGQNPAFDRAAGYVLGWHAHALAENEPALRRRIKRLRAADPYWD